jgi:CheY-like chemotaxis protein
MATFPDPGMMVPIVNILILDPNETVAGLLQELLALDGHTVESVRAPTAAFRAIARRPFDVALIDVSMHDTLGSDAARSIRSNYAAQIKLVAIAGIEEVDKVFDHHLPKPLDFDALRKIVSS